MGPELDTVDHGKLKDLFERRFGYVDKLSQIIELVG